MSQENVEIVRRLFEEASRGDPAVVDMLDSDTLAVIFKHLHPMVEFHEDPRFPEAGIYRGIDEARNYWERFTENFDLFSWEVDSFIDAGGEKVLALQKLVTRGRGSGATVEVVAGWIYTIREGLVVRIDAFLDRDKALEAVGLSE